MPRFDHTGPEGKGSRTGRGMGKCGKAANAAGCGMDASQNMGRGMGQGTGQGRCCRHGQRHGNRGGNCAMNGQEAGMGRGEGRGMGRGMQGPVGQAESCGAGPAAGSDAAGNNG